MVDPSVHFNVSPVAGSKKKVKLYTSVGVDSSERLTSALHGMLTSPSIMWFSLRLVNRAQERPLAVRQWLQDARDTILSIFNSPRLGFNTAIAEVYQDIVAFGTGVLFIGGDIADGMFQARPISEIYIQTNDESVVDTVWRKFTMTAKQAVDKFGSESLPPKVQQDAADGKQDARDYLHCVKPRSGYMLGLANGAAKQMPWQSIYVDVQAEVVVQSGGFRQMPYLTPRWRKHAGEIYGRSPGMSSLSEIQTINSMERTILAATEKAVDPPLQVPDSGHISPLKTFPGGLNFYQPGTRDRIEPMPLAQNFRPAELEIEKRKEDVRRMFFLDLLSLPLQDRMTTVEVMQRRDERMQQLSPVLSRLYSELLGPLISRVFDIASREGLIEEPPEGAESANMDVEYLSPLALAQRASEEVGLSRLINLVMPLAQADPSIMQGLNPDEILQGAAQFYNVSPRFLRSIEEVQELREQAAAAQQAAAQASMAKDAGSAAKDFGSAVRGAA